MNLKIDSFDNAIQNIELCTIDWLCLKKYPSSPILPEKKISLVDLFCGCGGLTLGVWEALRVHNSALTIQLAMDNNHRALELYKKNFNVSDEVALSKDINELFPGEIGGKIINIEKDIQNKFVNNIDILIAGPPCQGHSNLNNHTRNQDPKNKLYLKVIRFAELVLPKVIIIENVASIIKDKNKVVAQSESFLSQLGYQVHSFIINSLSLKIPQMRKRHILVATQKKYDCDIKPLLNFIPPKPIPLSEYIGDLIDEYQNKSAIFYTPSQMSENNQHRVQYLFEHDLYELPNSERPACHRNKKHKYGAVYGRLRWDKPAPTITGGFGSMGQGRFIHPLRPRVITAHEAARIQGFPDFFDFSSVNYRSDLYQMIGNAVPPKIAATIVDMLLKRTFI